MRNKACEPNDFLIPLTLKKCQSELRSVQKELYTTTENSKTHHRSELNMEQAKHKSDGDTNAAKAINQIIRVEILPTC